ncbi:MAG: phenylalanine--tRNA ligase beta subunit-related protein [Candidatus Acidiferrales bacterium]
MIEVHIELPGVKLGVLEIDAVNIGVSDAALVEETRRVCERIHTQLSPETVLGLDPVRAVRTMFRSWGIDPARYRPASEALLRRVAQGKGLYRISNVVDAGNLGSLETGWPYGIYNRALITPPVAFRAGATGETYEGIGKQTWHLAGRPVLADAAGAFGSPISDSTRTMVTEAVCDLLAVIYAPAGARDNAIESALSSLATRLERSAGSSLSRHVVLD